MTKKLFQPVEMGDLTLANCIVMAPLTRNRAKADGDLPYEIHEEYYAQRASAGLLITEAAQISPEGKGYAWTPGIYSDAQVEAWKKVTDAVHDRGGRIFMQLWHVGRISHTSLQPNGQPPVSSSAIKADAKTFDGTGFVPVSEPRALETEEIPRLLNDYRKAAENAKKAGFDGIELHAANGYLIEQFLKDGVNQRTDQYGGSIENRTRLLREVLGVLTEVWPAGRVGVRLSLFSNANAIADSDPMPVYTRAGEIIDEAGLGYLHLVEGQTGGERDYPAGSLETLRSTFSGLYMGNNGYDRDLAVERVENGEVDLVAFGRPYIGNPDLAERLEKNAPLNESNRETWYGGGAEGYTDYPVLEEG